MIEPKFSVIALAVAAGAAAASKDVAAKAVKDAYNRLITLIKAVYRNHQHVRESVDYLEKKPEDKHRIAALEEELKATGVIVDECLLEAAQPVIDIVDSHSPEFARSIGIGRLPTSELEKVGLKRLRELNRAFKLKPEDFVKRVVRLSWIEIEEIPEILSEPDVFSSTLIELDSIIRQICKERGLVIFGYLDKLVLNFRFRVDTRYLNNDQRLQINLGTIFFLNELDSTFKWLYDIIITRARAFISLPALANIQVPTTVRKELLRIFELGNTVEIGNIGRLKVSGKRGVLHPIGRSILRFILAHEIGHMIYWSASPRSKDILLETVWSDYDDALAYASEYHAYAETNCERLARHRLDSAASEKWPLEFIADGFGFYIAKQVEPFLGGNPQTARQILQIAIEVLFHTLVIAYHGDMGTESHPSPLLRGYVIRTRQRKEHQMGWPEFLSEKWGVGMITSTLCEKAMSHMLVPRMRDRQNKS